VLDPSVRSLARKFLPLWALEPLRRQLVTLTHASEHAEDPYRELLAGGADLDYVDKRVVLVCSSLGPGGTERQVVNTAAGLAQARIRDVHLLCDELEGGPNHNGFFLERARATGAAVRTIRTQKPDSRHLARDLDARLDGLPLRLAFDVANLYYEFRALRPNVVHAWLDYTNVRAGLAAVLAGVPRIVLSGRNMAPHSFPGYHPYFRAAYQALRDAPGVSLTNNSRAGAEHYAEWLGAGAGSINVIYNGLDDREAAGPPASSAAEWRRQWRIPAGAPVMGGMSRFSVEKRPWLWLETAAKVAARRPDTWFVLFGEGQLRPKLRALAEQLGITERLRLPGLTDAPFSAMRAMDVFVLTSASEGIPNVLLEAQTCGVPVVATRAGGSPEATDHSRTGWIVDGDDSAAIADRVVATLADRRFRDDVRDVGPRFVSSRFGLDRMVGETLKLYGLPTNNGHA
jgi:glycosyltransferase involved in cell wall biosynthesis